MLHGITVWVESKWFSQSKPVITNPFSLQVTCHPEPGGLGEPVQSVFPLPYSPFHNVSSFVLCINRTSCAPAMKDVLVKMEPFQCKVLEAQSFIASSRAERDLIDPAKEEGNPAAASLLQKLSSFRVVGMMVAMKDVLDILNECNRLLQFRLLTYKGMMENVRRSERKLERSFLGDNGVQSFSFKAFLAELGGVGGEAGLRYNLAQSPNRILRVKYKNAEEPIRIKLGDLVEVEAAARQLAQGAKEQIQLRFQSAPILECFSILDPQCFPTEEGLVGEYGNVQMEKLVQHFGQKHAGKEPSINPDKALQEWDGVKDFMYSVRKDPCVSGMITALLDDEKAADKAEGCGDGEGDDEEKEPEVDEAGEAPLLEREQRRKDLNTRYFKVFAKFWRTIRGLRGAARFPNVYKLAKIYITLPLTSIECERGFSAQNRIKSKARNRLEVPRLEALMKLSLAYRQQGVDLTSVASIPILEEAAKLFDELKRRR